MQITELTRRNIIEALCLRGNISGRVELCDFLKRTWKLSEMPSYDCRFPTAEGDIWQHMVNNNDWDEHYLFFTYLEIFELPDQRFLHFLEQVIHPSIRRDETQSEYANIINSYLLNDGYRLNPTEEMSGFPVYKATRLQGGVPHPIKNLIFAAKGPKPEIVLVDAVNNDIQLNGNPNCLVYTESVPSSGLSWSDLVKWWAKRTNTDPMSRETEKALYQRLHSSLDSPPERLLFDSYFKKFYSVMSQQLPALIPQIYLHYDPYTVRERNGQKQLPRQRMDFLLLLPNSQRVVIEVDGKQHYADQQDQASPRLYAEMVAEDRELKLRGYEVYRFGGYELQPKQGLQVVEDFFLQLFKRNGLLEG